MGAQRSITPAACRPIHAPEVFGVSKDKIYDWAKAGHVTLYRDGGVTLVIVSEVLDYIRSLGDQLGGQQKPKILKMNENKALKG